MARYTAKVRERNAVLDRASRAAASDMAVVYEREIVRRLQGGYTSGAFVTGAAANAVRRGAPEWDDGAWRAPVYTDDEKAVFWELGHRNLFTRRYERVEHWRLAMEDTRERQFEAGARAFARVMRQAGAGAAGGPSAGVTALLEGTSAAASEVGG